MNDQAEVESAGAAPAAGVTGAAPPRPLTSFDDGSPSDFLADATLALTAVLARRLRGTGPKGWAVEH